MTCSSVKIFDCNVFLSKLSSVFLTDEKSFTIMLLLLSLEWKRLISIPEWELSFMMSLNSWCFFGEKQTPQCSVLSFCIKKLKYLLWTPLLETPPKDTQIQIHLNNKLKKSKLFKSRKSQTFWNVPGIMDCCQTPPSTPQYSTDLSELIPIALGLYPLLFPSI